MYEFLKYAGVLTLLVVFVNISSVYKANSTVKQAAAENDRWQLKSGCEELINYERKFTSWIIGVPIICDEYR